MWTGASHCRASARGLKGGRMYSFERERQDHQERERNRLAAEIEQMLAPYRMKAEKEAKDAAEFETYVGTLPHHRQAPARAKRHGLNFTPEDFESPEPKPDVTGFIETLPQHLQGPARAKRFGFTFDAKDFEPPKTPEQLAADEELKTQKALDKLRQESRIRGDVEVDTHRRKRILDQSLPVTPSDDPAFPRGVQDYLVQLRSKQTTNQAAAKELSEQMGKLRAARRPRRDRSGRASSPGVRRVRSRQRARLVHHGSCAPRSIRSRPQSQRRGCSSRARSAQRVAGERTLSCASWGVWVRALASRPVVSRKWT
jgi:hypothetical protein